MRLCIIVIAVALIASPAFGLMDYEDNSINQDQQQQQGQAQGQAQGQGQGQAQIAAADADARACSNSTAIQGQAALQGNRQESTEKNTTYVMTSPDTVAQDGQSAVAGYSIFGGLNIAESAEYKVCIEKIPAKGRVCKDVVYGVTRNNALVSC